LISEVFFDDAYSCTKKDIKDRYCDDEEAYHPNEERIEIFNIGEGSFEGVLTLSGTVFSGDLHSYTYSNVSIPAGGYIVLANTGYFFRIPNNEGLILNSVNGFPDFDIPDDKELLLDLIVDDEVVDTFLVLEHWMKDWSYYFESVHKVVLESDTLITRAATHKNENIYSDYMANP
jgi:hypothetical protein